MFLPFLMMFLISLSGEENIFTNYKHINLSFCAYKNVFSSIPAVKYFLNSLIVALATTIGQVIVSLLAGYGFARLKFKGSDTIFFYYDCNYDDSASSEYCSAVLFNEQIGLDKYLSGINYSGNFWWFWRIFNKTIFSEFFKRA